MLQTIKRLLKQILQYSAMFFYEIIPTKKALNTKEQRDEKIIISFTSYPKRFKYLHLVVKSLMLQTKKPDRILLYLGDDSIGLKLPKKLEKLQKFGLSVEYRTGNLKSHKKYFYALQEFPEDIVILVDDDMIYEPRMIERLYESYEKYPNAVSAKRVHRMTKNPNGEIANYNHWMYEYKCLEEPSLELFSTTGFGTLLPPHCMDSRVCERDVFVENCFEADDVWLKCMQILKGTPTVFVNGPRFVQLPDTQVTSLSLKNVFENRNDYFIDRMEDLYGCKFGELCSITYEKSAQYTRLSV